mmetsp:Transcript_73660/g.193257  ORF Transcript_73660/g.193257 Transcript_73660/m.193257 type:complete len:231 (-) Transcript_73660:234-926(-)
MAQSILKDGEACDEMKFVQRRGPPRRSPLSAAAWAPRSAAPSVAPHGRFAALDEAEADAPERAESQEQQEEEVAASQDRQVPQKVRRRKKRAGNRQERAEEERLLAQMASEAALERARQGPEGATAVQESPGDVKENPGAAADPPRRAAAMPRSTEAVAAPALAAMAFATQLLVAAGAIDASSAPDRKVERRRLAAQPQQHKVPKAALWGDGGKRPVVRQPRMQLRAPRS